MFDKVLLLLLVILLPVGIVASRSFTGEINLAGKGGVDEKQVEEIVAKYVQQPAATTTQSSNKGGFNITAMLYATESSTLKVVGMAPYNQELVWVWIASSQTKKAVQTASPGAILDAHPMWDGPLVIQPQVGGMFSVDIDMSLMSGTAEVRLEQRSAVNVFRYDLDKQKQL